MSDLSPRVAAAALIATLLVAGVWPYHEILGWLPWGADALRWVGEGSLDNPGWWRWSLAERHFVGYRPVTALSFVGNDVLGASALGYRATDLGLHLVSGVLLSLFYRRFTGDRSACSLVPLFVLLVHPASSEIVPYTARRSYLLALALGLGALLAWLETMRPLPRRWPWSLACAGLLGLAVLSNEVAYVLVPLLPLVAILEPDVRWRARLVQILPALVVTGLAIAARYAVLGTLGGYQRRLFAFVRDGVPMWIELRAWEPGRIATACWQYLLDPTGPSGADPLATGVAGIVLVSVLTAWLAWSGVVRPLARFRDPAERAPLVFAAWLVGALAIVVLSQTWFWRQAHSLLAPLGMLMAVGLRQAAEQLRTRPLGALPLLAAGLVALLAQGWNGPLWTGLARGPHRDAIAGTRVVARMDALLGRVRGPATVYLVAPLRSNAAHVARMWGRHHGRSARIEFRLLAHLRPAADPRLARVGLDRAGVPTKLVLKKGLAFARTAAVQTPDGERGLPIDRLWRSGPRETWLFALDADDSWALRVPEPPDGVAPIPDRIEPELPPDEG